MSAETIMVQVKAGGLHRLDVFNAATGVRLGTINVRPREAAKMTDADLSRSVSMYCKLANAMHPPQLFAPSSLAVQP